MPYQTPGMSLFGAVLVLSDLLLDPVHHCRSSFRGVSAKVRKTKYQYVMVIHSHLKRFAVPRAVFGGPSGLRGPRAQGLVMLEGEKSIRRDDAIAERNDDIRPDDVQNHLVNGPAKVSTFRIVRSVLIRASGEDEIRRAHAPQVLPEFSH